MEPSFPDERVQDAYLHPLTDDSQEQFEWGTPDLDLLRQYPLCNFIAVLLPLLVVRYAREKFAWDKKKTDQELIPVIRSLNQRREVCLFHFNIDILLKHSNRRYARIST